MKVALPGRWIGLRVWAELAQDIWSLVLVQQSVKPATGGACNHAIAEAVYRQTTVCSTVPDLLRAPETDAAKTKAGGAEIGKLKQSLTCVTCSSRKAGAEQSVRPGASARRRQLMRSGLSGDRNAVLEAPSGLIVGAASQ